MMQNRPIIKARLSDTDEAWDAMGVLASWRRAREMSKHLPRAIRLYAALLRGDLSVMDEYFPYLTTAIGSGRPLIAPHRQNAEYRPAIAFEEKSDADNVNDLLDSLGM